MKPVARSGISTGSPATFIKRFFLAGILAFFVVPVSADSQVQRVISPGDYFPDFRFSSEMSGADAAYLGVSGKISGLEGFSAHQVWGDLLVLEVFNRYCYSCQQQAPLMNKAYEAVVSDPFLSTKVRFLGVGTGNSKKAVHNFAGEFLVPFPLLPDPKFEIMSALGNPGGTPFTLILRKTSSGMMVVKEHYGSIDSPEQLVSEIRNALEKNFEEMAAGEAAMEVMPWIAKDLKPPLSEDDIMDRVQESIKRAGYGSVGLYTVKTPSGEKVYIGESKRGKVFSRMISRLPVCDVCHPIHFIITFNSRGQVIDFDAVFVTKYWNREWNTAEVEKMRKSLVGISVLEDRQFNPDVDAVSTATMSSSIIFDSVIRTGKIFEILKTRGHL